MSQSKKIGLWTSDNVEISELDTPEKQSGALAGVSMNNEAIRLSDCGEHEKAISLFHKCLAVKRETFKWPNINVCISLSGLADAHLEAAKVAKSDGELKDSHLTSARAAADEMLTAARQLQNSEQIRIASEILHEIDDMQGTAAVSKTNVDIAEVPSSSSSSSSTIFNSHQTHKKESATPSKRCYRIGCPQYRGVEEGTQLYKCGRCREVYYCGVDCQK